MRIARQLRLLYAADWVPRTSSRLVKARNSLVGEGPFAFGNEHQRDALRVAARRAPWG